jgi:chemotaxis protein CheX
MQIIRQEEEEAILKTFASSVIRYFITTTGTAATLKTSYLGSSEDQLALEFSAVIGISGSYRGNVYFTASRANLNDLLIAIGEKDIDDNLCGELVGEIANTFAGNAKEALGSGFMISTPFLLHGPNESVRTAHGMPCFVLPIEWKNYSSRLLISLEKSNE